MACSHSIHDLKWVWIIKDFQCLDVNQLKKWDWFIETCVTDCLKHTNTLSGMSTDVESILITE